MIWRGLVDEDEDGSSTLWLLCGKDCNSEAEDLAEEESSGDSGCCFLDENASLGRPLLYICMREDFEKLPGSERDESTSRALILPMTGYCIEEWKFSEFDRVLKDSNDADEFWPLAGWESPTSSLS